MTSTRQQETDPVHPHRRGRRIATWVGVGVAVAVAAIAAYWALARTGAAPAPPPITTTPTPTYLAAPAAPVADGAADGCLGGPDPATAVLAAQQTATLDEKGAAEFALTVNRWTDLYPTDLNMAATAAQITTPGYLPALLDGLNMTANARGTGGYTSAGSVPGAADEYRVADFTPGESATINVVGYWQTSKSTAQQFRGYGTLILDVIDGHWTVAASPQDAPADPYAAIPGVPWQPYSGVC